MANEKPSPTKRAYSFDELEGFRPADESIAKPGELQSAAQTLLTAMLPAGGTPINEHGGPVPTPKGTAAAQRAVTEGIKRAGSSFADTIATGGIGAGDAGILIPPKTNRLRSQSDPILPPIDRIIAGEGKDSDGPTR